MTEVEFHFNVGDAQAHARAIAQRAACGGVLHVFTGDADTLRVFGQSLWSAQALSFVPHSTESSTAAVQRRSRVCLLQHVAGATGEVPVLVNLGAHVPGEFERARRLIEIVGPSEGERAAGRSRWRHYADRGYTIKRHDGAAGGA